MSKAVLDSSALLAFLSGEGGTEQIRGALRDGAVMSALNLAEVVGKLAEAAVPEPDLHEMIDPLGIEIATFDVDFAYAAGLLRPVTRHAGLSLGDRACLVLAQRQGLPALTTDRAWAGLNLDVVVRIIR